jgi:hypothetical protein
MKFFSHSILGLALAFVLTSAFPSEAQPGSFSSSPLISLPAAMDDAGLCEADEETLCLLDGRLSATLRWRNQRNGQEGVGQVMKLGERTGYFWFFQQDNVEVLVKTLDGTAINGAYWVFLGSMTDLEFWLDVTHLATRQQRTVYNPPGHLYGYADIRALPVDPDKMCGTIAGIPCPTGQVCDYNQGCNVSDAAGVCVTVPDVCPAVLDPVCGCNDVTYTNDCERLKAQVVKSNDGPCAAG